MSAEQKEHRVYLNHIRKQVRGEGYHGPEYFVTVFKPDLNQKNGSAYWVSELTLDQKEKLLAKTEEMTSEYIERHFGPIECYDDHRRFRICFQKNPREYAGGGPLVLLEGGIVGSGMELKVTNRKDYLTIRKILEDKQVYSTKISDWKSLKIDDLYEILASYPEVVSIYGRDVYGGLMQLKNPFDSTDDLIDIINDSNRKRESTLTPPENPSPKRLRVIHD